MKNISCKHCNQNISAQDTHCPNCGIPLPPQHGKSSQSKFILYFIAVVLFSAFMIIWLPQFG